MLASRRRVVWFRFGAQSQHHREMDRADHLHAAAEHLDHAGLHEEAEELRHRAEALRHEGHRHSAEMQEQIENLHRRVGELSEVVERLVDRLEQGEREGRERRRPSSRRGRR